VGECPPQKHILYLEINCAEQNGYLKILIRCVWGNDERGGPVALQSLSAIKKGTRTLNFQSNEPLLKFLRRPLPYEVPFSKEQKYIVQCANIVLIWPHGIT
jgi:hypothetical protein